MSVGLIFGDDVSWSGCGSAGEALPGDGLKQWYLYAPECGADRCCIAASMYGRCSCEKCAETGKEFGALADEVSVPFLNTECADDEIRCLEHLNRRRLLLQLHVMESEIIFYEELSN